MEFHFDENQDHQTRAIAAIADLFNGQPWREPTLSFDEAGNIPVVANNLNRPGFDGDSFFRLSACTV